VLFDVFAVVPFVARQAEEPLFEDRIFFIPEGERKTKALMVVRYAQKPVFPPPVGARTGMVMREILPCRSVFTVIFADRSPLPLGQVRTPSAPMRLVRGGVRESLMFWGQDLTVSRWAVFTPKNLLMKQNPNQAVAKDEAATVKSTTLVTPSGKKYNATPANT